MAQVGRKINELNEEDKNSAIVHEIEKYPPCKNKYSKTQQFNCKKNQFYKVGLHISVIMTIIGRSVDNI